MALGLHFARPNLPVNIAPSPLRERLGYMRRMLPCLLLAVATIAGAPSPGARAQEIREITLAQQFGAIFIPLMAMENLQLIEKQAAAQGVGDLKVNWAKLAGP